MIKLPHVQARALWWAAIAVLMFSMLSVSTAFGSSPSNNGRIINGTRVGDGPNAGARWDSLVALLKSDYAPGNEYDAQFCGGTLIATEWVVTAAHCMVDRRNPALTDVLLDQFDLTDGSGLRAKVAAVYVNRAYNSTTMANDIALLYLAAPVPANVAVPMPLATDADPGWAVGDSLWAAGWGSTASYNSGDEPNAEYPEIAREVAFPRIADAVCSGDHPGVGEDFDPTVMLCAGKTGNPRGDDGGLDTCQGDSGGPVVTDSPTPALVGIVSYGFGCGSSTYGVYSRVATLGVWVTATIANPPVLSLCVDFASDAPEREVTNLHVLRSTFTTVTLQWEAPVCDDPHGFDVWHYSKDDISLLAAYGKAARVVTIRRLAPGKFYHFNVDSRAGDDDAENYYSNGVDVNARTRVDFMKPTRPGRATNRGAGRGSVVVGWGASRDNDRVRGYRVYYKVGRRWRAGKLYPANARKGAITRLARHRTYIVSVRAVDYAGRQSAFARAVRITTR